MRTEAYIDREDVTWNKWIFDAFYEQRGAIEAAFGEALEWERLDDKRACRIAIYRTGSVDDPPQTLENIQGWAIDRLLKYRKILGACASALAAEGPQLPSPVDGEDVP